MKPAVLITGAAKRLGREMALYLSSKGFDIALHYNSSCKEADELKILIEKEGGCCDLFCCDLMKQEEVRSLISEVVARKKNLSLLINSASVFQPSLLIDSTEELFESHFQVNFKAPYFLSRDFSCLVKKGQIINILDTRVERNASKYFPYTLSKKVLKDFTLMAASELAPDIRVNAVAPGFILPPENKSTASWPSGKKIPLGMKGGPEHLIKALNYLIDNEFVTGEVLFIDGGERL